MLEEGFGGGVKHCSHSVSDTKYLVAASNSSKRRDYSSNATDELIQHPHFSQHQLQVMEPSLCDPSVKQYSGYLDVTNDKHLFFWFFESCNILESAPLLLWLNGGLGCSSSTGLFFELGPCSISDRGFNTTYNSYSWNTHANIIFLDQPVSIGFSYAEDSTSVDNSQLTAKDVYAFLELFLTHFPAYSKQLFHLAAESCSGIYAPNIAIIIGNGLMDGYIQYASMPDYLCEGPYLIFDNPNGQECVSLRSRVHTCQRLIRACHISQFHFVCSSAEFVCNLQFYTAVQSSGLNPYDVHLVCDPEENGPLCYRQMSWIERYMNIPEVKAAIGVAPQRLFKACNMGVNLAFLRQGDSMWDMPASLPKLINSRIQLLVYAGVTDMMCNFIGKECWLEVLHTDFLDKFLDAPTKVWITSSLKKVTGTIRSAGGNGSQAGNITFVTVLEAGHMVPYDQPEAALDLIMKWIFDLPLTMESSFL
ncbi:peptidase S10 serine carboxypeptidase [Pisolithus sp. B1]|nr:peptidase S10 serine carboxypeptidase [Pisolithus sp. B1]